MTVHSSFICEGAAGFRRLANEELVMVLQYLDLVDRLLIRRVSKRWRFVMAQIAMIQHIKAANHPVTSGIYRELLPCRSYNDERPRESWRYCSSHTYTLIIDYDLVDCDSASTWWDGIELCLSLTKRLLPSLTTLCIANYWSCDAYAWSALLCELPVSVRVVLRNGVVGLFGASDIPAGSMDQYFPDGTGPDPWLDVELCFVKMHRWCIRIPNMDVSGAITDSYYKELSRVMWPYGEAELRWLASNAPTLNGLPKLLHVLWRFVQCFSAIDTTMRKDLLCPDHVMFCEHLDVSHYRQLNGLIRRLLSLCILNVREDAAASVELQGSSRYFQDDVCVMKDYGPSHLSQWMADYHEWKIEQFLASVKDYGIFV